MFKVLMIITLTTGLTSLAQSASDNFLNGIYDMKINIGGTIFNDVMEIKGLPASLFKSSFTGSITVPGAFTAPIEQGQIRCPLWSNGCDMNFSILAKENGKSFRVYYHISFDYYGDLSTLSGKATLDNNGFLGYFTAVKRQPLP